MLCSVDGCTEPVKIKARGLCRRHYMRWWHNGSPSEMTHACAGCGTAIGGHANTKWCGDCRSDLRRCRGCKVQLEPGEIYCSATCQELCRRQYREKSRKLTCADCGQPCWQGSTSLPQGEARCRPCHLARIAARKAKHLNELALGLRCEQCSAELVGKQRRFCSDMCRYRARGRRDYGTQHAALRRHLLATLVDGTPCPRCDLPMCATDHLDLDHTDDRSGYLGLSHRACNRNTKRGLPQIISDCPICGVEFKHRQAQRTCSRPCGVEWKRRQAA